MGIFGMIFMILAVAAIYCGINFYISTHLYKWLTVMIKLNAAVFYTVYWIIACTLILYFAVMLLSSNTGFSLPYAVKQVLYTVSAVWMGIFVYLLLSTLVVHTALGIVKISGASETFLSTSKAVAGVTVIALTLIISCFGFYNGTHIKTVSYSVSSEKEMSDELNIVLISDIHLGSLYSEKNFENAVEKINGMSADLVLIAGDIFNDDITSLKDRDKIVSLFSDIRSEYGVFACLGNHDGGRTFDEMTALLEDGGVVLLNDEYKTIDGRCTVVGRVDSRPIGSFNGLKRKDFSEISADIPTDLPLIVMDHNPANIAEYGKETDLVLSGHTHKGQLFPGNLITNAMYTVDYGYYKKDENSPSVIVTSGVGTWGVPMRVGTSCEIVQITLK